jgi:hypothetical protein
MRTYSHQNQEQAFTRYVETRDSQEGTNSLGGYKVGIDPELAMSNYINDTLKPPKNSILTDSKVTYGVVLLTGKPQTFVDRADYSEGEWLSILDHPIGKVRYMLVSTRGDADLIRKQYPGIGVGRVAGLVPIFHTERYVLVQVEPGASASATAAAGGAKAHEQPHLVTPKAPLAPPPAAKVAPSEAGLSPGTGTGETGTATPSEGALSPLPGETGSTGTETVGEAAANSAPKVEGE